MGNCFDCVYKKTIHSDLNVPSTDMVNLHGTFFVGCDLGNIDTIAEYYRKYGDRPSSEKDTFENVDCFVPTKVGRSLDRLDTLLDDLLNEVKH